MKVVVGLGNPEPEYTNTRHNAGKDFVNLYIKNLKANSKIDTNLDFKKETKFKSYILKIDNIIFVKPDTFMNESGESVQSVLTFYKIETKNLCVCYDELDLTVGNSKLSNTGSKIHNGVNSITLQIKSADFNYLRIGVREEKIPMSVQKFGYDPKTYVLSKFSNDDLIKLHEHFKSGVNTLLDSFLRS